MPKPILWGDHYILCGFCKAKPSVYIFWERTDGRNGPVCEDCFAEPALQQFPEDRSGNKLLNVVTVPALV